MKNYVLFRGDQLMTRGVPGHICFFPPDTVASATIFHVIPKIPEYFLAVLTRHHQDSVKSILKSVPIITYVCVCVCVRACVFYHNLYCISCAKSSYLNFSPISSVPGGMGTMPEVTRRGGGGLLKKNPFCDLLDVRFIKAVRYLIKE